MKKTITPGILVLVMLATVASSLIQLQASEVQWNRFSRNLVRALQSDNPGLRQSAMQFVVKYGELVNVNDAVFEVMYQFRFNKNVRVRQLALVALSKMNHGWANGFLRRQIKYEGNPVIQRQLIALQQSYAQNRETPQQHIDETDLTQLENQLAALNQ